MPDNFQQPTNGPSSPKNPSASERGSLGSKAHEASERLKDTAVERVEEVREKAVAQRTQIADRVRRVSSAVREAGEKLRDEDQLLGRYAGVAADGIERAASYLGSTDPRRAIRDLESFARGKPALFFGGAFLVGLAAGRFLKSSQSRNHGYLEYQGSRGYPPYPHTSEVAGNRAASAGGYPAERETSRSFGSGTSDSLGISGQSSSTGKSGTGSHGATEPEKG